MTQHLALFALCIAAAASSCFASPCVGTDSCVLEADDAQLSGSKALEMLHLHSEARTNPVSEKLPDFVKTMLDDKFSKVCWNRQGVMFVCGANYECCGDVCVVEGGACCTNKLGNDFSCGKDSECCGNACMSPGSKCCENAQGYQYPVTAATVCADELSVHCENTNGDPFLCGKGSSCCGDICVAPGGTCCANTQGHNFACGKGDSCCGNACAAAASSIRSQNITKPHFRVILNRPNGQCCPGADMGHEAGIHHRKKDRQDKAGHDRLTAASHLYGFAMSVTPESCIP